MKIRQAVLSVHDKNGIVELAKALTESGIEIISTGGTAKLLKSNSIKVREISELTNYPEMLDGRVKSLHPKIYAGILADRKNPKHMQELERQGIEQIDLVVVNLYPFEETISKAHALAEAIENIDIGGPALIRAAAKNFENVAVVVDPNDYEKVCDEIKANGKITEETRRKLAEKAWQEIAYYDAVIARYFSGTFPEKLALGFRKKQDLRYGENPHQKAAFYIDNGHGLANMKQLQGKELSYNNILDTNAAWQLVCEFDEPTAVIVKHNNPSGVASHGSILEAYKLARSVDPEAAFGGVVAINNEINDSLAKEITSKFVEVIIAPAYTKKAIDIFAGKKNIRILQLEEKKEIGKSGKKENEKEKFEYRSVAGGLLIQEKDAKLLDGGLKCVTKREPSKEEMKALFYAWKVCKYVKSNAIVYANGNQTIGIGAGQMKRVDAAKLGAMIAKDYSGENSLRGCAMASDAFLPFRDGVDHAAKLGVTAIIQPGGSIKDSEVIAAANGHGIAMVFTGIRHFRH